MGSISLRLDDDIIQKLRQASAEEKARWEEAFNLWWRVYFVADPLQKLDLVTNYFRKKAQERGLTEDILEEILNDEKN